VPQAIEPANLGEDSFGSGFAGDLLPAIEEVARLVELAKADVGEGHHRHEGDLVEHRVPALAQSGCFGVLARHGGPFAVLAGLKGADEARAGAEEVELHALGLAVAGFDQLERADVVSQIQAHKSVRNRTNAARRWSPIRMHKSRFSR